MSLLIMELPVKVL